MKISIEKLDRFLDFVDQYRSGPQIFFSDTIELPDGLDRIINNKKSKGRKGYYLIPRKQVKGVVVVGGGEYPLSHIDLPFSLHLAVCETIHAARQYSLGSVASNHSGNKSTYTYLDENNEPEAPGLELY